MPGLMYTPAGVFRQRVGTSVCIPVFWKLGAATRRRQRLQVFPNRKIEKAGKLKVAATGIGVDAARACTLESLRLSSLGCEPVAKELRGGCVDDRIVLTQEKTP
jgi:hypothetical protein